MLKLTVHTAKWLIPLFFVLLGIFFFTAAHHGHSFLGLVCFAIAGVIACYYLIERYAGALPLWMMPTQVKVLPITDRAHAYAKELSEKLNALNIHAETDCRSEKLGYKIREAQMQKIPYMLVIGDRDMENGTVSVRTRKGEDLGAMTPDAFIAKCLMEIATKSKEV